MEVRKGYKQTEVGVIPKDWEIKKLGDFATIGSGGTPSRQNPIYWGGNIPWITTTQIDFNVIDKASEFITKEGLKNSAAKVYRPGTLLMAMYGQGKTRGKVAILGIEASVNQACAAINLIESVLGEYVFYNLSARYDEIRGLSNTGNQENLNSKIIKNILTPIPPLPEQHAITTALSNIDSLLTALDAVIAKKRLIKQGAMQELLTGKKHLPGFNGKWEVKTLDELFHFSGGYTASRDQLSSNGYCYLHYGDIHMSKKTFVDLKTEFYDIPKLNINLRKVSEISLLNDGDIVFVDASEDDEGASRHVVIVNPDKIPFISGLHTIVAKGKTNELVHSYRRYCFQTRAVKDQFRFYAVGTKVTGISKTNIAKINLPVPSIPEQQAITEVLSDMDAEIAALEARREKTSLLKQGMMQELLTGKTRLV